jgi:hypothetical protein
VSDYHYPPYPCCGGLAFHVGGASCKAYRRGEPLRPFAPTPFRCPWVTMPADKGSLLVARTAERHGSAFRAARVEYGLTLRDVAAGWRISEVEVGELERGLRCFRAPADLHAALQQLWCWASEKNQGIQE